MAVQLQNDGDICLEDIESRVQVEDPETLKLNTSKEFYILKVQDLYSYQIPGFTVLTVLLRRVRVQIIKDDGSMELLDCLLNEEIVAQARPPTAITVTESCTIKVGTLRIY